MDTKIHFFGEDSKPHKWGIDPLEIILSTCHLTFGGLDAVEQPMVDWPYGEV